MRSNALLAAALISLPVAADPLDFNYLQADFVRLMPDAGEPDERDGYRARLASPLEPGTFLLADYLRIPDDGPAPKFSQLRIGLGSFAPWRANTSLFGAITYERDKANGVKAKGYGIEAGLRWAPSAALEFGGGGRLRELDDQDRETIWLGHAIWSMTPKIGLAIHYEQRETAELWSAGLHFTN